MQRHVRFARCAIALAAVALVCVHPAARGAGRPAGGGAPARQVDYFLRAYEIVTLDTAEAARRVRASGLLRVPSAGGALSVHLARRDMRSKAYRAETSSGGAKVALPLGEVATYAGVVPELGGAQARFTVEAGRVTGMILLEGDAIFLEPLANYEPDAGPEEYVLYRGSDVNPDAVTGTCEATEAGRVAEAAARVAPPETERGTGYRVIQLATEADNEYVAASGSAAAANSEILSIMNEVEGVYQRDLGLTFEVVYQHAWDSSTSDPYSGTDASAMLEQFRSHWNSSFTSIQRDVAHMWTGRDMNGSTIGIAYVGVVCRNGPYSYGVSQRWSGSPQRYILTAHEIGHNLNACHSDTSCNPSPGSCSNTVMQSSVGTGFSFCGFSQSQISAYVSANSSCLPEGGGGGPASAGTSIGNYVSSTSTFFLKNSNAPGGADMVFGYGAPNSTPIAGDWDANGSSTIGTYVASSGTFFLRNSNSSGAASMTFAYGPANAIPVAGDWDGDGDDTIGVYVPSTGTFFLKNSNASGAADIVASYGPAGAGWRPVVGDWNGDGRDTIGLYSPATGAFYLKNTNASGAADMVFSFGPPGASPVAGDWSGLGRDSVGVYIPGTAVYFLRNSTTAGPADVTATFGAPPITGLAGNWDGV